LTAEEVFKSNKKPAWTQTDHAAFHKFSARHKITASIASKKERHQLKELLAYLGFIGHNDKLDDALAERTAAAVKYVRAHSSFFRLLTR